MLNALVDIPMALRYIALINGSISYGLNLLYNPNFFEPLPNQQFISGK